MNNRLIPDIPLATARPVPGLALPFYRSASDGALNIFTDKSTSIMYTIDAEGNVIVYGAGTTDQYDNSAFQTSAIVSGYAVGSTDMSAQLTTLINSVMTTVRLVHPTAKKMQLTLNVDVSLQVDTPPAVGISSLIMNCGIIDGNNGTISIERISVPCDGATWGTTTFQITVPPISLTGPISSMSGWILQTIIGTGMSSSGANVELCLNNIIY